jgi:hypothetical protein
VGNLSDMLECREKRKKEKERKKKEENPFWYPMPGPFLVYN